MKDELMLAISHELRTPITICRGHLDVLNSGALPEEVRDARSIVTDELDRMSRIVEDLTTLASGDAPGFIRPRTVELGPFLKSVAAKAKPLLGQRLVVLAAPADATFEA